MHHAVLLVALASTLAVSWSRVYSRAAVILVPCVATPTQRQFATSLSAAPFLIGHGGMDGWEAPRLWTDEYLARVAGDEWFMVERSSSGLFGDLAPGWSFQNMTLAQFVATYSKATPRIYLNGLVPKSLHGDILMPHYVPCLNDAPPLSYQRIVNMWFGRGGEVSLLHNDLQDNLLHMVRGSKTVILFAPNQTRYLYERRDIERTETRVSPIDPTSPDLRLYPLFSHAQRHVVTVAEGEVLYIPALWWHHVASHGSSIAVNIWWDARNYAKRGLRHVYATPTDDLAVQMERHAPLCTRIDD